MKLLLLAWFYCCCWMFLLLFFVCWVKHTFIWLSMGCMFVCLSVCLSILLVSNTNSKDIWHFKNVATKKKLLQAEAFSLESTEAKKNWTDSTKTKIYSNITLPQPTCNQTEAVCSKHKKKMNVYDSRYITFKHISIFKDIVYFFPPVLYISFFFSINHNKEQVYGHVA